MNNNKWILCSQQKPPKYKIVFVTIKTKELLEKFSKEQTYLMFRNISDYYVYVSDVGNIKIPESEIIAWMPCKMPKPYQGENKIKKIIMIFKKLLKTQNY